LNPEQKPTALNKLLWVDVSQYGYHTDAYHYCNELTAHFEVSYIGCDDRKPERPAGKVRVLHPVKSGNALLRNLCFFGACIAELRRNRYDVVFVCYTPLCSTLKLAFPRVPMIADVRTGFVERREWINRLLNAMMLAELSPFRNVSFVSGELAQRIGYKRTFVIIPVGSARADLSPYLPGDDIKLLYVGILTGRKLDVFLRGLRQYFLGSDGNRKVHVTIVGYGSGDDEAALRHAIGEPDLHGQVEFIGELRGGALEAVFQRCNAGLSYVPVLPKYDAQPPTKTFEYLMHGMPVLATATQSNRQIVDPNCGVLIGDDETSVCEGLYRMVQGFDAFDRNAIREKAMRYDYGRLAEEVFLPFLRRVLSRETE
jgi:glycosyltransferase involved in cell wall biosynthesis